MGFKKIYKMAAKRKGGEDVLLSMLPGILTKKELERIPDDRFLAAMCRVVNQAGFNWSVINNKWPQFEEAFYHFDILKLYSLSLEEWEAYLKDKRVVRNWQKIKALMKNLELVYSLRQTHGSFAKFIANWPESDQIGLMDFLKRNGSRLGGNSGMWFLRFSGKDAFILTRDVVLALINAGVDVNQKITSKRDLKKVQDTFNEWHQETGLPYSHLSRIAAYSIGVNYESVYVKEQITKFSFLD
ncbi:MAG: DNA-3-methyladenine glycosylase I [Rickettsiales bacterium]|nr:DNA-3-methyladenine glycosylase I [Rickettsiales bacterium]